MATKRKFEAAVRVIETLPKDGKVMLVFICPQTTYLIVCATSVTGVYDYGMVINTQYSDSESVSKAAVSDSVTVTVCVCVRAVSVSVSVSVWCVR